MSRSPLPLEEGFETALTKIENCAVRGDTTLDLSGLGLVSLPPEVGKLRNLKVLFLNSNRLTELPSEIGQLEALEVLQVSSNHLKDLRSEIGLLVNLTALYLSSNNLTAIPADLGNLDKLTELILHSNDLTVLPPEIGQLNSLRSLNLEANRLEVLPPEIGHLKSLVQLRLRSNQLRSLPPEIGELEDLSSLVISFNRLDVLPPEIGRLSVLTSLDISSNRLENLPPELGLLTKLKGLFVSSNNLRTIPAEIGRLTSLGRLFLESNKLEVLPPEIGQLASLKVLSLSSNELTDLPEEIGNLSRLNALFLHGNPRLNLPPVALGPASIECEKLGNRAFPAKPTEIIAYFFGTRGDEGVALREVKVIFVGRGEVGKSSMVDVLQGNPFIEGRERTDGIAIRLWPVELDDGEAQLSMWDFGGQEIMHGTHQFFMTHRSLYLVMVDGRHDRGRQDAEYWLKLVRAFGGESPVMVVMNRQRGTPFDMDRDSVARKYSISIENFFRTDCEDLSTILPLRDAILKEAAHMLGREERFPSRFWEVKSRLSAMKENGEDYLSDASYQDLCIQNGIVEEPEQRRLLQRLSDLGTVVSFPRDLRLSELSVLNPEWATEGIYRVVTNEDLREKRHGLLTSKVLRELLPRNRWPRDLHVTYVLDLMRKFDLCFPVEGEESTMLVPELLVDKTPPLEDWNPEECLVFQYAYSVLPYGVIPRFITRTHRLSATTKRWRSGVILKDQSAGILDEGVDDGPKVILEDEDAEARIQADYDSNTITIWVRKGHAGSRRDLLAVIRSHFESIHDWIEGLNPMEMIAVPGYPDVLVGFRDVLMDERRGRDHFPVTLMNRRVDWPIEGLLNGVQTKRERDAEASAERTRKEIIHIKVEGDYILGTKIMKDDHSIKIGGDVVNSQVGQTLANCKNIVQQQSPGKRKDLMEELEGEAAKLIASLPDEDQRKKASKNLMRVLEVASEVEPEREWYELSAKGLMEAASYVKDFSGNVAATLKNLGRLLWPDFLLPGDPK